MFKGLLARVFRSRRVIWALLGNGSVSISSFVISAAIAREVSVEVFGTFSFALVAFIFCTGLVSAAFTNIALVQPNQAQTYKRNLKRTSLVSLLVGTLMLLFGFFNNSVFLIFLGISLHGLMLSSYQRTFGAAAGRGYASFLFTLIWTMPSIITAIVSFRFQLEPSFIFGVWSISGALSGYLQAWRDKSSITPSWNRNRNETRQAAIFSAEYLVGQGGSTLTTGLLGFLDNAKVLGAIRGSGTLLGPVNLLSTTARSLLLPVLARMNNRPNEQIRSAIALTIIQVALLIPVLGILQFIPENIGIAILGDTWHLAEIVILPMSIDALFTVVAGTAISAHRAFIAGARALALRLVTGLSRPFIVLFCAYQWSALGAAYSMALVAVVSAILWWFSYWDLCRRRA